MMRGSTRTCTISISINALHFLDWPVTRTHVMQQAKKAGQESAAAFTAEWSARGQSVATPRWMARKLLCFFSHLYVFLHDYKINHSHT